MNLTDVQQKLEILRLEGLVVPSTFLSVTRTKGWEEYSTAVAKEWFYLGGIPHLAKQWLNLVESYEKFREV